MRPIADIVSVCIVALFAYPVIRFAETTDPAHLIMLVGMLFAEAATKAVKIATQRSTAPWLKRPEGAKGCDAFCADGDSSGAPGFPSGHLTAISFFVTYIAITTNSSYTFRVAGLAAVVAVSYARISKKCHTPTQVAAGALWGAAAAWMVVFFCRCMTIKAR
jgi:membrane-associated phospholipid phosphatase